MDLGIEGDGNGLGCLLLFVVGDPTTEELLPFGLLGFAAGDAVAVPPLRPFDGDGRTCGGDAAFFTGGVGVAGRGN